MNKAFLIAIGAILLLAQVAVRAEPAKKAPPLVLVANKYSYTFGTPDGWDHSFEQAREFGVPLAFFPKGGSFHESNTVIYINELCRANCTEALNTVIERILTNTKDTKSWENDFKAFQEIIGGHHFFNCDSPGLAVPCR